MKNHLTLCFLALIAVGCLPEEEPNNNETIDYIHQTGRLWGVEEVTLNENGSITLIDAKSSGVGLNLIMRDSNQQSVDSVTLNPGQSCLLSDFRHAFITYEFKAIKKDRIIITVTDKFDARSFGNGIKQIQTDVTISPYKKQVK